MGCATGLVKYLVFLANLVFALAGLALVIIGVLYKLDYNNSDATKILPTEFGLAPILSIIVGAIVFITAFMGCCGAVKESPCMLTTYAIILLTIFIIQVAIGVYAFLQIRDTDGLRRSIRDSMQKTFDQYSSYNKPEIRESVDLTQTFLHCCGVEGPEYWRWPNGSVPLSCCEKQQTGSYSSCSSADTKLYHQGCARAMFQFLENSSQIIGGVAIGIAAIEIIGAVFGLCLASSIRNQYRRNTFA